MSELAQSLNNLSAYSLAFDELALRTMPDELAEAVGDYAREILADKVFIKHYKELINMVIRAEIRKREQRDSLTLRKKILISEQIWLNATKNLNTLALNTAIVRIKQQLKGFF